ncbi:hypothetical protein K501DRAFT_337543 [Backusella circina FSU 941]|nr:hypothetical protein K501DRAFT_337543 [Backusella circina FSU 941]
MSNYPENNKTDFKYSTSQFSIICETPGGKSINNKKSNKNIDSSKKKKSVELRFKMESVGNQPEDDDDLEQCPSKVRSTWPNRIVPWWKPECPSEKPPYSYATLIAHAILSSKDGRLTLSDIYKWISEQYPFYKRGEKGWQNSIRHNLSLNKKWFIKLDRRPTQAHPGKGGYWTLQPDTERVFVENLSQTGGHSRKHADMGVYSHHLCSTTPSYNSLSSDSDSATDDFASDIQPSIHIIRPIDYELKKNKSSTSAPRNRSTNRDKNAGGAPPPSTQPMKLVFRCNDNNSRSTRKSVDLDKKEMKAYKRRSEDENEPSFFPGRRDSVFDLEPSQSSKRRKSTTTEISESIYVPPQSQFQTNSGYPDMMMTPTNSMADTFPTLCMDSPMNLELYSIDPVGYDAQYYTPSDLLITKEFSVTEESEDVAQKLITGLQSQVQNTIHLPSGTMSVQYHIPEGFDTSIFQNTNSTTYDPHMNATDLEYYEISKVCDVSPTSDLIESHWDECFENLSEFVSLDHAGNEIL